MHLLTCKAKIKQDEEKRKEVFQKFYNVVVNHMMAHDQTFYNIVVNHKIAELFQRFHLNQDILWSSQWKDLCRLLNREYEPSEGMIRDMIGDLERGSRHERIKREDRVTDSDVEYGLSLADAKDSEDESEEIEDESEAESVSQEEFEEESEEESDEESEEELEEKSEELDSAKDEVTRPLLRPTPTAAEWRRFMEQHR